MNITPTFLDNELNGQRGRYQALTTEIVSLETQLKAKQADREAVGGSIQTLQQLKTEAEKPEPTYAGKIDPELNHD